VVVAGSVGLHETGIQLRQVQPEGQGGVSDEAAEGDLISAAFLERSKA
jgi:hypothetical protein